MNLQPLMSTEDLVPTPACPSFPFLSVIAPLSCGLPRKSSPNPQTFVPLFPLSAQLFLLTLITGFLITARASLSWVSLFELPSWSQFSLLLAFPKPDSFPLIRSHLQHSLQWTQDCASSSLSGSKLHWTQGDIHSQHSVDSWASTQQASAGSE